MKWLIKTQINLKTVWNISLCVQLKNIYPYSEILQNTIKISLGVGKYKAALLLAYDHTYFHFKVSIDKHSRLCIYVNLIQDDVSKIFGLCESSRMKIHL